MIFFENKKIKEAAIELDINYTSAKNILKMHRNKLRAGQTDLEFEEPDKKKCKYAVLNDSYSK
jgi:hypothetical protein